MATPSTRLYTIEDLETLDDSFRYDLIRGELRTMSPAGAKHGRLVHRIDWLVSAYVEDHSAGELFGAETGFILSRHPDVVLAPDLAFVRSERFLPEYEDVEGFLELAPDLVVEVMSPSDTSATVAEKVSAYLDGGVALVWVIDPRRRLVTVHDPSRSARSFDETATLDGGDVLPGFRLPVAEIFRT